MASLQVKIDALANDLAIQTEEEVIMINGIDASLIPTEEPNPNDPSWVPSFVSTGNAATDAAIIRIWREQHGLTKPE
jgi:hypothetical protein